ncbi:MAG: sulfotransferase [Chloroflexi bacterium]|nr:sulfotransferase [Chloroflexota bacterium]
MEMLNRLKAATRILLKGEVKARKRTEIPAITAEEVAEIKQFFPREKSFILGHARSGTTILMRLARLHPEVHCNYQAHFFTRAPMLKSLVDTPEAADWLSRKSNRWNQGRDLSPLVMRAAADFIMERDAACQGKRIVGDKSPSSTIHGQVVRDMHAIYPDARVINIVRDGRDVLISERFRNFVEDSKYLTPEDRRIIVALKVDQAPFTDGRRSIFTDNFIRRIAKRWVDDLTEVDNEAQRLYAGSYFPLRYEDLLADPYPVMQKLWAFLGVQADPALEADIKNEMGQNLDEEWQARRAGDIASFLPKGKAGNWRNMFTVHDRQIFKEIAGELLVRWGYEKDGSW